MKIERCHTNTVSQLKYGDVFEIIGRTDASKQVFMIARVPKTIGTPGPESVGAFILNDEQAGTFVWISANDKVIVHHHATLQIGERT